MKYIITSLAKYDDINTELTLNDFGINALKLALNKHKDNDSTKQGRIVWPGAVSFTKNTKIRLETETDSMEPKQGIKTNYTCLYLVADKTPLFFLLPKNDIKEKMSPYIDDNVLWNRIHFTYAVRWLNTYMHTNPILHLLYNYLYVLFVEINYASRHINIKFEEVPNELMEIVKSSFFKQYYKEVFDSAVQSGIPENEDDINEYVQKKLNELWESTKTDSKLMDTLLFNFIRELQIIMKNTKIGEYITKRTSAIMYHNGIIDDIEKQKNNSIGNFMFIVRFKSKIIKASLLMYIDTSTRALNWLFGAFSMINRWSVLHVTSCEIKSQAEKNIYYKNINKIHYADIKFSRTYISVEKIGFESLIPNVSSPPFIIKYLLNVNSVHEKMDVFFNNYLWILNMIKNSSWFVLNVHNRLFKFNSDLEGMVILVCGFLLPVVKCKEA